MRCGANIATIVLLGSSIDVISFAMTSNCYAEMGSIGYRKDDDVKNELKYSRGWGECLDLDSVSPGRSVGVISGIFVHLPQRAY